MGVVVVPGFSFGFDPEACKTCPGNCCIGTSGYTWLSLTEMGEIAAFIGISADRFVPDYLRSVKGKFCLKELAIAGSFHCVFFDDERKACSIYPVRPKQCRTFPFWEHFKNDVKGAMDECPGVVPLAV